jgi:NADH dehydrogenase
MRYRRVTIIGASGFVGRYVVKDLAQQGVVIAALSRHAADDAGFLRPMGDVGQVAPIEVNILDEPRLAAALAGAEAAVNATGILYESGKQTFEAVHHQGAALFARVAKAAGVKALVHLSAIGADSASPAEYARSKARGEAAVRAAFPEAVILRPSIIFGPEDEFFNRFGGMTRYSPLLPLIGGGQTRFQPVYVGDVASAAVAALERLDAAGRTFELGGPQVYTFRQLMEMLLQSIRRRRALVNVPWGLANFEAAILERLPAPLLTRDQVRMLQRDNVVAPGAAGLAELGVTPTALELVLPTYLDKFRRGGRWVTDHAA